MINRKVLRKARYQLSWGLIFMVAMMMLGGCNSAVQTTSPEVWGRAEAKEVDINSKIPGRVISLLVKEGDRVEQGQVLARIDNRDIVAQSNQAQANIQALEAQSNQAATVTDLQSGTTQAALDNARAQLEKARADLALTEADYNRYSGLVETHAVSRQIFDTYKAKYEVAQAGYNQAQAAVQAAEAGLKQTNVNQSNEAVVHSRVQQAQAGLQQVQVALGETEIIAPFAGIVSAKYVEEGAMISSGMPIVAIQDPTDNWVNLKVKETELSKYVLQQTVQIQGRDSNLNLPGIIVDISKKPEFATYRATTERGDNDIITFNVKIQTNSEQIRPGMRFKLLDGVK